MSFEKLILTLITPKWRRAICIYAERNADFSKFISSMYHSIRDYSKEKRKCWFITKGERDRKRPIPSRDVKRARHLIDCVRPRTRARQLWSRSLYFAIPRPSRLIMKHDAPMHRFCHAPITDIIRPRRNIKDCSEQRRAVLNCRT